MYERMLDKTIQPSYKEMSEYCSTCMIFFLELNELLKNVYKTEQQIVFPYGNNLVGLFLIN